MRQALNALFDEWEAVWVFAIGDAIIKASALSFVLCVVATYGLTIAFCTAAIGPAGIPVGFVVATFIMLTSGSRRRGRKVR